MSQARGLKPEAYAGETEVLEKPSALDVMGDIISHGDKLRGLVEVIAHRAVGNKR